MYNSWCKSGKLFVAVIFCIQFKNKPKVDREGSLSATCQPNNRRLISQFKPTMASFTPWCHSEAGMCFTPHNTTSQADIHTVQLARDVGRMLGLQSQSCPLAPWFPSPRAGSIFKGDDCRVKQSLKPLTAAAATHSSVSSKILEADAQLTAAVRCKPYSS